MHGEIPDNTDTTFSAAPGGDIRPDLPPPPKGDVPPKQIKGDSQAAVEQLQAVIQQAQSSSPGTKKPQEPVADKFTSPWLRKFLPTILTSFVIYSLLFGFEAAAIIIALFTIHEMGHWMWMKANKLDPQPPMYVPFLGAFVMMKQPPEDESTAAWVALAGPLVGGIGAAAMYGAGLMLHRPELVIGGMGGFLLNLAQLLPARPFDGGAVVAAVSRHILVPGTLLLIAMAVWTKSPLLILISFMSILSLFHKPTRPAPKLAHTGNAKTMLELEQELLEGADLKTATDTQATASSDKSTSRSRLIPATTKQRFAIGTSYLALGCALSAMMFFGTDAIVENLKDYASTGIATINHFLRVKPDSSLLVRRGYCFALQNDLVKAEQDAQAAIKVNSSNGEAYYALGTFHWLKGQNDKVVADNFYKAAQLSKPGSLDAWYAAYALALSGHYEQALLSCSHLTDGSDKSIKAMVIERTVGPKDAQSFYDASVKSEKWGPRARRAMHYLSTNQAEKAKSDLDDLAKVPMDPPLIRLINGWYDLKTGQLDAALNKANSVWNPSLAHSEPLLANYDFAAAHRLKSEVYKRMAAHELNEKQKAHDLSMAATEFDASRQIPGMGTIYIPVDVDKW